jgi:hypothetical protein
VTFVEAQTTFVKAQTTFIEGMLEKVCQLLFSTFFSLIGYTNIMNNFHHFIFAKDVLKKISS